MIRSIDVFRYRLPLRTEVRLGAHRSARREGLCVRVSDGQVLGWGDVAPLKGFSRETLGDVLHALATVRGLLPAAPARLLAATPVPTLRFAIDSALHEMEARMTGSASLLPSLVEARGELRMAALVEALEGRDWSSVAGYAAVKLKVGADWRTDLRRVEHLRSLMGSEGRIRLDANRRFPAGDARAFLTGLAGLGVDFLEEPVAPGISLPDVPDVALAVDETVIELLSDDAPDGADLVRRVRERAPGARVLVIKPALFGSWDFTQTVAAAAVQDGLRVVFGGAYESGVGVRAGLAIAALAAPDEAVGFDSYNRLERDLLRPPLELDRPTIDLRDAFRLDREVTSETLIPVSRNA